MPVSHADQDDELRAGQVEAGGPRWRSAGHIFTVASVTPIRARRAQVPRTERELKRGLRRGSVDRLQARPVGMRRRLGASLESKKKPWVAT